MKSMDHNEKKEEKTVYCENCNLAIPKNQWKNHISTNTHIDKCVKWLDKDVSCFGSSFQNRIESYKIKNSEINNLIPENFFKSIQEKVINIIQKALQKHESIKYNCTLHCNYILMKEKAEDEISLFTHHTKMLVLSPSSTLEEILNHYIENCNEIIKKMSEFQERDSGWTLIEIKHLEININKYTCLRGSQYINLPPKIRNKKACINVQNNDVYCFKWAIISALNPLPKEKKPHKCSNYKVTDIKAHIITLENNIILNFENMEFPLTINKIRVFELQNPDISINVFGLEDAKIIGPYYFTEAEKSTHINLLLIEEDDKFHYIWIKNISRLLRSSITKNKNRIHFCNTCLTHVSSSSRLEKHKRECKKMVTTMPSDKDKILKFKNFKHKLDIPFSIYADFECILQPLEIQNSSKVKSVQKHIPFAYSYYIKCSFDSNLDKIKIYSGEDCTKHFFNSLVGEIVWIYNNYLSKVKPMNSLTSIQLQYQKEHPICHICEKSFLNTDVRVADHCHLTGEYRGPAHKNCNLEYQIANFVPVFFHNLSAYDSHLFVRELSSVVGDINILPLNKELYISISKRIYIDSNKSIEIRFLDSCKFMASSLEKLAGYLSDEDFNAVKSTFVNDSEFNLMKRKGVFPYDYLDSPERLEENALPPISNFFNKLTNEVCSEDDYTHAKNVWNTFKCNNLKDYLLLYLKVDVLLLCDVFENFRKVCKKIYNLDPCQYYTAPGLSWSAMLKTTGIELELLTDFEKYNFIVEGIRGGIVQCSKRFSVANNIYVSDYNPCQDSNFLIYLDVNNLYGYAMSQYLPYKNFEWVGNIEMFNLNDIKEDSEIGYILEVDLEYPSSLHDYHNDLPFCAENKKLGSMRQSKLVLNLNDKNNYIIHYKTLQQCIKHGLVLKKIHRILQFKQTNWLQKYIDLNNYHRTLAKNLFEQNFFKLLNNAVYGKTMENVDKRKCIKIVTNWESKGRKLGARALIAKPNFHSSLKISNDMVVIQMKKSHVEYNKPIYIGFTVLELSKWKMYDFHYNYMKIKFNQSTTLNYMDTDSFIYDIKTKNFYDDIRSDITKYFDTSAYPINNIYNFPLENKKVLGMMKDECGGKIMKEFIGLRSKMYSIKIDKVDEEIKKIKGVKHCVTAKLSTNDFKKCLFEQINYYDSMYVFRSKIHQLYTQHIHKLVLNYLDDKRFIRENGVDTYAWGHYKIKK
ncbi:uncharacterized protein LOC131995971 isoform X1 [Stomoxys calcitrans]|nr:uncharacterized protein LOC131995971 isoform X1 [Stomoxys calcitrans]